MERPCLSANVFLFLRLHLRFLFTTTIQCDTTPPKRPTLADPRHLLLVPVGLIADSSISKGQMLSVRPFLKMGTDTPSQCHF